MKTLNQFVRDECANFKRGNCVFDRPCSVLDGARCSVTTAVLMTGPRDNGNADYFGACVAPLARTRPEYADAAVEYGRICGTGVRAAGQVRLCGCGQPLAKRQRYCGGCQRRRQREATRTRVQKHRDACNALTPKTAL